MRLGQAAKILNITTTTIVQYLKKFGHNIDDNLNFKLTDEQYARISEAFAVNKEEKEQSSSISIEAPTESLNLDVDSNPTLTFNTIEKEPVHRRANYKPLPKSHDIEEKHLYDDSDDNFEVPVKEKRTFNESGFKERKFVKKEEVRVFQQMKEIEELATEKKVEKVETRERGEAKVEPVQPKAMSVKEDRFHSNVETPVKKLNILGFIDISKRDSNTRPSSEVNRERAKYYSQLAQNRRRSFAQQRSPQKPDQKGDDANKSQNTISAYSAQKIKNTLTRLNKKANKNAASKSFYKKEKFQRIRRSNAKKTVDNILEVTENISLSDFAALLKITPNTLLDKCQDLGLVASLSQRLNAEVIDLLAGEYGFEVDFVKTEFEEKIEEEPVIEENLEKRAPVVTVIGHVDHGKTSLLDYIRKTNVTKGEEGGITQHIGAYKTHTHFGEIVFLDTPGHEAFTAMRVRGIDIADIVVLLVAADDGIHAHTRDIISQIKMSNSHIVVAINKIDKEGAAPEKIKEELAQMNILVEDWGGKYQCQHISAKTGEGVDALLEKIILEADTMDLKADPSCFAKGIVMEAYLDKGRGFINTGLVQKGKIKVGDAVVAGPYSGKVRALINENGKSLKEAGPSTPVQIVGLNGACKADDKFAVVENEKEAKKIACEHELILRQQFFKTQSSIQQEAQDPNLKVLNIIVKGDVYGSIQALADSLVSLQNDFVKIHVIDANVGIVNDSDVNAAITANASIICFNVKPSPSARKLATQRGVEIKTYSIIYDAIDEMEETIRQLSIDKEKKVVTGRAEVKALFKISKVGMIAGCFIIEGSAKTKSKVQVVRNDEVIFNSEITQIKHYKADIKEAKVNTECGIFIKGFSDYQEGDILECYEYEFEMNK